MAAANLLGKVPCLVMDGQDAVFDSRVIVDYLDTLSPVGKLILPRPPARRGQDLGGPGRRPARRRRGGPPGTHLGRPCRGRAQPGLIARQLAKVDAALAAMSAGLADKPWCSAGIHLSLADIAAGCALGYLDFRFADIDWRACHANLAQLMERLMQRPSFAETVPKDWTPLSR